jgi:hypothetical protein
MDVAAQGSQGTGTDLVASLNSLDKPVDVIRAAGAWLAVELASESFMWLKSRQTVERRAGKRREQIHLQGSKWNHIGAVISFSAVLIVRDGGLAAWRRANSDLTTMSASNDDWLCSTQFGTLFHDFTEGGADLGERERRLERLLRFAEKLRTVALPWFGATKAELRLDDIPESTLDWCIGSLIELMICRGENEQAQNLLHRWLALGGWRQEPFEIGQDLARKGLPPDRSRCAEAVGWSSVVLGLS